MNVTVGIVAIPLVLYVFCINITSVFAVERREESRPGDYDALMLPVGRFSPPSVWDRGSTQCGWVEGADGPISTCRQLRPVAWWVQCSWDSRGREGEWDLWWVFCHEEVGRSTGLRQFWCGVGLAGAWIWRECRSRDGGESWGDVSLRYEADPVGAGR